MVRAGNGGNGAVSFHREKYVANGGPDGGDGGRGGNVYFQVDDSMNTLEKFTYRKKYTAEDGANGAAKRCAGKYGADLIVKVPRGTLVYDNATGRLLADCSSDEPVLIAKGGRGGAGNQHFATATRQIPRFAKPGEQGEFYKLRLELKLLADVGLVGFPNVGKSTLISVVSAAKPVIANYHFTTITPVLGVVKVDEYSSFVMADIPGLIEGAADGVGLGHDFLRHVDRCRLIVHVVDVSGSEGRDPKEDFAIINRELKNFNEALSERPQIVVANKCDMATEEQIAEFEAFIREQGYTTFFAISAATTQNVKPLVYEIANQLKDLPPILAYEADPIPVEAEDTKERRFEIVRGPDAVFYVDAPFMEQVMNGVNMDDYESLQYFQRVLRESGIIDKLEQMGIKEGDTVDLFGFQFEFVY
jgi:GTP-binding protein